MLSLNPRFEQAIEAVARACSVTRHVQHDLEKIQQLSKDDRSPVTVADFAAQAIIAKALAENEADLKLIGEENAAALRHPDATILKDAVTHAVRSIDPEANTDSVLDAIDLGNHDASASSYWTLDPVDGTKGFLRGGQYAISLAFIENGEVIFGVLGCPNLSADFARPFNDPDPAGSLYVAAIRQGTWYLPIDNPAATPEPIAVSAPGPIENMRFCESVESGHSKLDDSARIAKYLKVTGRSAQLDSQCKYAVVARGQADAYLRLPTGQGYVEKIWDHAAGKLIAEQAGAKVSDIKNLALDFSKGALLTANSGVICANNHYHAQIIDAIEVLGI